MKYVLCLLVLSLSNHISLNGLALDIARKAQTTFSQAFFNLESVTQKKIFERNDALIALKKKLEEEKRILDKSGFNPLIKAESLGEIEDLLVLLNAEIEKIDTFIAQFPNVPELRQLREQAKRLHKKMEAASTRRSIKK